MPAVPSGAWTGLRRSEQGGGEGLIRGLALCAGVGGLELGLRLALGRAYRCVGYVERDAFAAALLVARMADQALDRAPVWDDLQTFDGRPWRGRVDLVSAGFPCQPASSAGRRRGTDDERWLWPHVARVVGAADPRLVFLENVAGVLTVNGGAAFGEIVEDLAALGFDAEWDVFSAAEVGAPHLRERLFLLAHRHGDDGRVGDGRLEAGPALVAAVEGSTSPPRDRGALADADRRRLPGIGASAEREGADLARRHDAERCHPQAVGDADFGHVAVGERDPLARPLAASFPPSPAAADGWRAILAERPDLAPAIEPAVRGVADGLAHRVDRLRAAGNGVVPLAAAVAFLALTDRARLSWPVAGESP